MKKLLKKILKWVVLVVIVMAVYIPQVLNLIVELNDMGDSIPMILVGMILSLVAVAFLFYFVFVYGIGD